jgi:hypothetical protein
MEETPQAESWEDSGLRSITCQQRSAMVSRYVDGQASGIVETVFDEFGGH